MGITYDKILGKLREADSGALTPATTSTLGGIKVGSGLAVALDGTTSNAAPAPNTLTKITENGTWTAPRAGVYRLTCVGAGGGGAGGGDYRGGDGGGGGGTDVAYVALAEGDELTVHIGAPGDAGSSGPGAGGNGGDSYIQDAGGNDLCRGGGGKGGAYNNASAVSEGGAGIYPGGPGGKGQRAPSGTAAIGGNGGYPNGGQGGYSSTNGTAQAGNAGGAGWAIIESWTPHN